MLQRYRKTRGNGAADEMDGAHIVGQWPLRAGRRHEVQRPLLLLIEHRRLLPAARLRPHTRAVSLIRV
jgi:hypothetical protein